MHMARTLRLTDDTMLARDRFDTWGPMVSAVTRWVGMI